MSEPGTITGWLQQFKTGNDVPVQPLWERYFPLLVDFARRQLCGQGIAVASGTDAALSAFQSFHAGVQQGRFPHLEDRHDLWRILLMLTRQKIINLITSERCEKRGGGKVQQLSVLTDDPQADPEAGAIATLVSNDPTPEFIAQFAEEYQRLLHILNDDGLRLVAVWKLEGYSSAEIAAYLGRSESTVERKLNLIRRIWSAGGA